MYHVEVLERRPKCNVIGLRLGYRSIGVNNKVYKMGYSLRVPFIL